MDRSRVIPWLIIFGVLLCLQFLIFGFRGGSEWNETPSPLLSDAPPFPVIIPSCPTPEPAVEQAIVPVSQQRLPLSSLSVQSNLPSQEFDPSGVLSVLNSNFDLAINQEIAALSAAHACIAAPASTSSSFTRCMRQVSASHTTPPAAYAPRASCAHLGFCSGFGACFV